MSGGNPFDSILGSLFGGDSGTTTPPGVVGSSIDISGKPAPTPTPTGVDPNPVPVSSTEQRAAALVAAEQDRTERQRIGAIQRQLGLETLARGRGYGIRDLTGGLGTSRRSLLGSG